MGLFVQLAPIKELISSDDFSLMQLDAAWTRTIAGRASERGVRIQSRIPQARSDALADSAPVELVSTDPSLLFHANVPI